MKTPYFLTGYLQNLPSELESLARIIAELATDLRWTWSHVGDALWKALDAGIWEQTENPFVVLQSLSRERLEELNSNAQFKLHLQRLVTAHEEYCRRPGWFGEAHGNSNLRGVAYFSMEFGLGEALPLYAGGLGVLAGDYLKAASDLGIPVVGIGLLYQEGYFRQVLSADGWQQDVYSYNDSSSLPIQPAFAHSGAWLRIPIELPGRSVNLRVWQAQVGRVTLYLLDSNDPLNSPIDQGITSKLYGGGHEMRLVQEIALGIGGWRLIEALRLPVEVCHLNEGHAAFAALERARCFMEQNSLSFFDALWATRAGNVFTTHTPVAAGFDTYHQDLLEKYGRRYAQSLGMAPQQIASLGRRNPDDQNEPFNMAYLAARTCANINGVSRLHSVVSRNIFRDLYPRWPEKQVPITHITNGVHVPSWDSPWADEVWTQSCGKDRWLGSEESLYRAIEQLSDEKLWTFRGMERADLVHHARLRLARQLGQRGADTSKIIQAEHVLDPNILTLGFARRFAEYKRPNLLLHDPERLIRLLTNPARPVQIIVAGKAHPQDEDGKRLIHEWAQFVQREEVRFHAVFLEDYDMALAQEMVQGVDVWINTPRRPWEACGTSGMKVLVNGGLNLSELDGWWAEAYSEEVGWAIGNSCEHHEPGWDALEAGQLYRLLEEEIVPMFYNRDEAGNPRTWMKRVRASMSQLAPQFSTNRMVREYVEQVYLSSAEALRRRTGQGGRLARELRNWELSLNHCWHGVHFGNRLVNEISDGWLFEVQVYLGEIEPDAVEVQLYADSIDDKEALCVPMRRGAAIAGALNGFLYMAVIAATRAADDFTARVVPHHPEVKVPNELALILWQR